MAENEQKETVVEEKPKKTRRTLVSVVIIEHPAESESMLVQWVIPKTNRHARGYVPVDKVEDGKCDAKVLEAAQPYGVPWGKLFDTTHITPERIELELHRRNIWTVDDLEQRTRLALGAITAVAGPIIGVLHQRGKDHERFEKEEGNS